jgi:hypothetical protein
MAWNPERQGRTVTHSAQSLRQIRTLPIGAIQPSHTNGPRGSHWHAHCFSKRSRAATNQNSPQESENEHLGYRFDQKTQPTVP